MTWIGVHYEYPFGGMMADRPEWMPKGAKDWRRDLKAIKDTGFNLIRIRVGLDTNIDDIATLLDICGNLDIKVMFGSAMFYVSDAFVKKYPDSATIMANGERVPKNELDYSWPRACVHHPVFRSQRNEFWEACAKRFKNHPMIIAWDVHNEPSLCGCYCDNTLAVYRKALEREFGNVAGYNKAFGSAFTGWADLMPPKDRNENIPAYRHWRIFMIDELNRFLNEGRDLVRKHVPDLPITYNPTGPFGPIQCAQDWWNLREYELMSCSAYWGSGEHTTGGAVGVELLKALGSGKDVWITEFQGGGFTFINLIYTGKHLVQELNAAFAHGSKGLIYYRWDPLLTGPEPYMNGMIAADTYDTEKRLTLKKGIAELRKYEDILDKGRSIRPSVGIFFTRDQVLHSSETGNDLGQAVTGNYTMLSALGYEAAFVLDKFDPATCPYDVMIFPYLNIDAALIPAIKEYARSGRKAIVELPPTDVEAAKTVGAAFGLNVTGRERPIYWFIGWDLRGTGEKTGAAQGKYMAWAADERLFFDAGKAKVLATYGPDSKPAIVAPDGCNGNLLAFGFPLGRTHGRMLHQDLRNFVGAFIGKKVKPDIIVKGACDEYRTMIETRVIETDKAALLFIINRGVYDYDLEVTVKGYASVKAKSRMYSVVKKRLRRLVG